MQEKPQERQSESLPLKTEDGESVVRYFKFFRQQMNPFLKFRLELERIPTRTDYLNNRKHADRLAMIFEKYHIDCYRFVEFCVKVEGVRDFREMLKTETFVRYSAYLRENQQYGKIYEYYLKSARNIAEECIARNVSPREYISSLVIENRLGYEYMSGRISKYFLATIGNFREIYQKLDKMNREELSIIYIASEELNRTVQDAFLKCRKAGVRPMEFVEEQINQIKNKINKENNKLCVN